LATAGDLETLNGWLIPALRQHFQFSSLEILVRSPKGDQLIPAQSTQTGQAGLPVEHPALGIFADSQPQSAPSAPIFAVLSDKFPNLPADVLFPLGHVESLLALLCLRFPAGADRESELELLKMLSGSLTLAFENAYLVEKSKKQARTTHELEIARKIQLSFLPESFPQSADFQIAAYYLPARQVGGDFYDVISLPDGRLALVMADVSDKGVPAALFMALSRSYVRVYSYPKGRAFQMASLESVLQAVNDSLAEGNPSSMFVTLFYGLLDVQNRHLSYVNAGHNPPLLVTPGQGQPEFISGNGIALGVFEGMDFAENHLDLERGQAIIFYTDGVTEARNPQEALYGEERLVQAAAACIDLDAEGIVAYLRRDLEAFVADAPQADDISLMVLKV
jgi:sigma-B regulation protein RsbU (phosphoserine phosphatase)